ncbi:sodium:solute symporter family protein [bacterium]|nr:sodium:solute symporter family protein [bacterium]
MSPVFIGILIYISIALIIGLVVSRKVHSESDYLIAGRQLGYLLATFSIFATWFGAETCVGASAAIYDRGLSGGNADPFGYTICLLLMALLFAGPMWKKKLTTLADLYKDRYSPGVEKLAAIIIAPSSLIWAAAQIRAFGHVLSVSSELQLETAILIATVIVLIYTVSGGLWADAYTDVIQGFALIFGLAVLAVVIGTHEQTPRFNDLLRNIWTGSGNAEPESWLSSLDGWAVPIFGSIVAQELISRVLAARSATVARRSAFAATAIYLLIGMIPVYIGLAGVSLLPGIEDSEQLMPQLALTYLPTVLYVMYAGALASAILSTVDSALLAASALIEHNVILASRPQISERNRLLIARGGVLVLGIVAYFLAIYGTTTYEMVEMASGLGSAGIFVISLFALYSRRGGPLAATAALIVGLGVSVWGSYIQPFDGSYVFSIAGAFLVYYLISLREPSRDLAKE